MVLSQIFNFSGLLITTVGGFCAAFSTASPMYNVDGLVSLVGEPDKAKRIAMHDRQKRLPLLLAMVGMGA